MKYLALIFTLTIIVISYFLVFIISPKEIKKNPFDLLMYDNASIYFSSNSKEDIISSFSRKVIPKMIVDEDFSVFLNSTKILDVTYKFPHSPSGVINLDKLNKNNVLTIKFNKKISSKITLWLVDFTILKNRFHSRNLRRCIEISPNMLENNEFVLNFSYPFNKSLAKYEVIRPKL